MNHRENFPPPFQLGSWLVQPDLNRISGPSGDHRIEPRVMRVLLCLARSPGQVWSREDLLDEVWGESVVGEEILTRAISELRRVFGDKAREPEFIETIRHHGYRLITTPAMVVAETPAEPAPLPEKTVEPEIPAEIQPEPVVGPVVPPSVAPASSAGSRSWVWPTLAVALLALAGVFGWSQIRQDEPQTVVAKDAFQARPMTSFPGREWHPALSPDGTRVAFVWSGFAGAGAEIHVKQQNSETPLQLTDDSLWVAWPAWSADGQTVAFVRGEPRGATLCLVPSLGGAVRPLHTVASLVEGLDYCSDGRGLVFSARLNEGEPFTIQKLDLETLAVKNLIAPDFQRAGDFQPRLSPDGQFLAWVGVALNGTNNLLIASIKDLQPTRVGPDWANIQGLAFAADGRSLVFSAALDGKFSLWRMDISGGPEAEVQPIATSGEFAWNPSVAADSGDLIYEQVRVDQDIWQMRILGRDPWQLQTSAFLRSTRWEFEAEFSPDGQKVAFISSRSGSPEMWVCDADGLNPQKMTALAQVGLTHPSWSPDGQWLAFNALQAGQTRIMVLSARGGEPRTLTPEGQSEVLYCWSHDSQDILFGVDAASGWSLRRRSMAGGDSRAISLFSAVTAAESADGGFLYFTRPARPGLWQLPLSESGVAEPVDPVRILNDLSSRDRNHWVLLGDEVYWILKTPGTVMLAVTDVGTGGSSLVGEMPGATGQGLAVSPDAGVVLYSRIGPMEGDLMIQKK